MVPTEWRLIDRCTMCPRSACHRPTHPFRTCLPPLRRAIAGPRATAAVPAITAAGRPSFSPPGTHRFAARSQDRDVPPAEATAVPVVPVGRLVEATAERFRTSNRKARLPIRFREIAGITTTIPIATVDSTETVAQTTAVTVTETETVTATVMKTVMKTVAGIISIETWTETWTALETWIAVETWIEIWIATETGTWTETSAVIVPEATPYRGTKQTRTAFDGATRIEALWILGHARTKVLTSTHSDRK